MKDGNQFLIITADSKSVLLLILRSNSFHKRNPSFFESSYRIGVFPDRIASLKVDSNERTSRGYVRQYRVTVNREYLTFW